MTDEQCQFIVEGLNKIARSIDYGMNELKNVIDNIFFPDNHEIANQLLELNKCMDEIIDIGHRFESGDH